MVLILVFARMTDVAVRLRRQVNGERVLRESIADLADVQDAATVVSALDRAVRRLLGPGKDYRLVLAPPGPYLPAGAEAREPQPRPTADLLPAVAAQLGDEGFTLALPLTRPSPPGLGRTSVPEPGIDMRGPTGHTDWPTLLVRSDRGSLVAIGPRLEVLASEAALALERIRLHETVVQHASEAYFRTVVQNSTDVILIINADATIRYASPSAETMLGPGDLHGIALPALVRGEDQARLTELLEHAQTADGTSPTVSLQGDWTVPRPGREPARVEASCRDLRHDPTVGGLVVTLRDVTVQRHLEHELIERAFQDPLTGLGNRAAFSDQLDAAVRSAASDNGVVAALFIDVDDMKVINDGHGHDAGDALLTRIGERLRRFVADRAATQPGMAARLGGDEFAVLLDDLTDQRTAEDAATQLVAELSQPVHLNGTDVTCTASVGIATTAEQVDSSAELLRHADLALYAAKAAGKGQSTRYQPWMRNAVMERLELRSALENAIANDALFLEYQPIVALDSVVPVGFEALLRWQHPVRGRLAPDTFISVAEESGLITPIGEWVLTTALNTLNLLTPGGQNGRPYIAVNVSARQFKDGDFVDTVRRVLSESGVPPELLLLEITESLLLRDDKTTWLDLQRLRRLGIRIAIDDFGTGYSALSYLRQVPLDIVKLDRTFIQHMTVSTQQRNLVEGIVNLTRTLGLQVVAEGIETDAELRLARQVGCDYGQGYLFSKPMSVDAIRNWLGRPERSPGLSPRSAGIGPVPDAGAAVAGPSMSVSGTHHIDRACAPH